MAQCERDLPDLRTRDAIHGYIHGIAEQLGVKVDDDAVAAELDGRDALARFRNSFHVPSVDQILEREQTSDAGECVYLCGNSLGLQPKAAQGEVIEAMDSWRRRYVHSLGI